MTLANAIIRVRYHLHTVHTDDPTRFTSTKLAQYINEGVRYVAERLPDGLAGDLITEDAAFTIGTSGRTQVPNDFYKDKTLFRNSDSVKAGQIDFGDLLTLKNERSFGDYSCTDMELYYALRGKYIYVLPVPTGSTLFTLIYRRVPTDPPNDSSNLDLPQTQYAEWACLYAAFMGAASVGDFNRANTFAQTLNANAKQVGIRNMFLRVDVADTQQEKQDAQVTA